jgi:LysR family transcriptional activator of nhaA
MEWLNYHHLLYFWTVVKEGGVVLASKKLRLRQPTVSGQIRALEEALGEKLFARAGRKLALTEMGTYVYGYADEIFTLGRELQDGLKGRPTTRSRKLHVGITDVVPKLIAHRLLEPALQLSDDTRLICTEDTTEKLLAKLAMFEIDLFISDSPVPPASTVRAFSHLLGESGVTLFAAPKLAAKLGRGFPACLDGAPFLMPSENTALRRSLNGWLESHGLTPRVRGEFQDSALMSAFGRAGEGVFAGPAVIEAEIRAQYGVKVIGRLDASVREGFYAITGARKLRHPAAVAISEAARSTLFVS